MADENLIQLTAEIVSAHVSHNSIAASDLPTLIQSVFAALSSTVSPSEPEAAKQEPAVSIRASVRPDYIVCLEDGKKLSMMKRYLRTNFDMSPEEYRSKWGLPRDYPMVAPNYAEKRRSLAQAIGLGRKKPAEEAGAAPQSAKRGARKAAKEAETTAAPVEKAARKPRAQKAEAEAAEA